MPIQTYPAGTVPQASLAEIQARLTAIETGPTRDNLVANGEFEDWNVANTNPSNWGTTWSTGSVTFAKETSIVNRGAAAVKITTALTSDIVRLGSPEFAVSPGDIVWIKFRGRANSLNGRFDVYFLSNTPANPPDFFQTGVSTLNSTVVPVSVVDTWQDYVMSFVVPPGMYRARFYINVSLSTNGAISAYVDSASAVIPRPSSQDDTGWITPTLINGWTQYAAPWGTSPPVGFRRKNGIVYGRGLVQNGTLNSNIFILPAGFRPGANLIISTAANDAFGELRIYPDGGCAFTTGAVAWVTLGNIVFPADG